MALNDNERIQEFAIVANDVVNNVGRKWWLALAITIIGIIPAYYLFKFGFVEVMMQSYSEPQIIYSLVKKEPLQILEKKIFSLPDNTYSAYVKVKNLEPEWGVKSQRYVAEFKTYGGSLITKIDGSTFILPSHEKLIVFSRFSANQKPDVLEFTLFETNFIHKPELELDLELERVTLNKSATDVTVYAGIKNKSAFTLTTVDLPAAIFDSNKQIVGVAFTSVNDVLSGETRTFQHYWPQDIPQAAYAEIYPQVNIFDPFVLETPTGVSPVNGRD